MTTHTPEQLRQQLLAALLGHNWYWDRRTCWRSYITGKDNAARIAELAALVPDGQELVATCNPFVAKARS
jgi:hypothetical protein